MTLMDRFICRREGHVPTFTLTDTSGVIVSSYLTSCQRCGKVYEVVPQYALAQPSAEDGGQQSKGKVSSGS